MKKILKTKYILSSILVSSLFFLSCEEDVDLARKGKPTLTFASNTIDVYEGNNATLKINFDYPIKNDSDLRVEIIGGTSTDGDDFNFNLDTMEDYSDGYFGGDGYFLSIPALSTSYDFNFEVFADNLPEGVETLELKFHSAGKGEAIIDQTVMINIHDTSDLEITLDWSGTFDNGGVSADFCDLDMDLELLDSDFNYLDFSYNDCPEQLVLPNSMEDGTYYLDVSLWTNNGFSQAINIPANVIFSKPGLNVTETSNVSTYFPMNQGGLDDGNGNAIITFILVKEGNQFTITDPTNVVVFQARNAATRNLSKKIALKEKKRK